jgi:hypothetical protein
MPNSLMNVVLANRYDDHRLPMGQNSIKEARIPDPWRMQLPLPNPCKYFLRMDLYKSTAVIDIL